MIPLPKATSQLYVAAAVTIAAGAAAVMVERKRRKKPSSKKVKKEKDEKKADSSTSVVETKKKKKKRSKSKEEKIVVAAAVPVTPESSETEEVVEPAPVAQSGNKKIVVLVTSYCTNPQIRANQDMAMTILKGLKIKDDQLETIDGAAKDNREKRNELFGVSGIRAKYPQFFVVDQSDTTSFLANWDDFQAMNEMGTLKQSLNLA